jgi:hypothetical protein
VLADFSFATKGQISVDGKWVAYASNKSGNWETCVTSLHGAAMKWQVSRGGGTDPRWHGDNKEILYIAPAGMLMAVPITGENTLATGRRSRSSRFADVPRFPPPTFLNMTSRKIANVSW